MMAEWGCPKFLLFTLNYCGWVCHGSTEGDVVGIVKTSVFISFLSQ